MPFNTNHLRKLINNDMIVDSVELYIDQMIDQAIGEYEDVNAGKNYTAQQAIRAVNMYKQKLRATFEVLRRM